LFFPTKYQTIYKYINYLKPKKIKYNIFQKIILFEKVGVPVGNPILVAGIDPIHHVIMPKVPNFPEISDETPNFHGNLAT
jgi:hypothetical protein